MTEIEEMLGIAEEQIVWWKLNHVSAKTCLLALGRGYRGGWFHVRRALVCEARRMQGTPT